MTSDGAATLPREGLRARLAEPIDGASLALLRIAFGGLMLVAAIRFWSLGWIDALYVRPAFHFTYWGFEWVRPYHHYDLGLPSWLLYVHFALLALAALGVALGAFYRVSIVLFVVLFGYVELLDATSYLNHYYAITIVGVLLAFLPAHRVASVDAWRARRAGRAMPETVPRAAVWALRAQLGIVYFFAGLAKVQPEWLLRAEPLRTWLVARTDVPLLGPFFGWEGTAYAMSWAGCAFDLSIPFLLLARRTRPLAYAAVIVFHVITARLFPIGMFPWVMIALTPIFFDPSWPRRVFRQLAPEPRAPAADGARRALPYPALLLLGAHFALQLALPLRHHLYPGDVLWNDMGMRWAWHVMIVERGGYAELEAVDGEGRRYLVDASRVLTPLQARTMATQPDFLLQFAHWVRDDFARRGLHVRVYADVWMSLNGRPARRLVDPRVDLAAEEDGLAPYRWVLPEDAPAQDDDADLALRAAPR